MIGIMYGVPNGLENSQCIYHMGQIQGERWPERWHTTRKLLAAQFVTIHLYEIPQHHAHPPWDVSAFPILLRPNLVGKGPPLLQDLRNSPSVSSPARDRAIYIVLFNWLINIISLLLELSRSPHGLCAFFFVTHSFFFNKLTLSVESTRIDGGLGSTEMQYVLGGPFFVSFFFPFKYNIKCVWTYWEYMWAGAPTSTK
jgi:hypothetical protein